MTIDKNNWFIREDSLTEEQYVEVCKYLVDNYEGGKITGKIMDTDKHLQVDPYMSIWYFVGVLDGRYTVSDDKCKSSVSVITYQQFLDHIKGVSEKPKSTSKPHSQSLQELTDNYVKAVRELTGVTTISYNLFINCEGVTVTENKRTSEDLKASGCSMQNLKGEFIE